MKKIVVAMFISGISIFANANDAKVGVDGLSQETRALLTQEMHAIENGMKDIFSNMISGNNAEVTNIATKIRDSFILKRNLTAAQREELHKNLPKEFIDLDRNFHATAGSLANAAEFEDVEEMNLYFSKMTKACINCHSKFAKSKFVNFKK